MRPSFPLSAVFVLLLLPSSRRTFTIIGIPAAALLSGLAVGIVMGVR
jgi:hypothetical protein